MLGKEGDEQLGTCKFRASWPLSNAVEDSQQASRFLFRLGVAAQPTRDCGRHDWHKETEGIYLCYHCQLGHRTTAPWGD